MKPVTPSDNEKINMLLDHFALICADKGDNVAVREIRKHIGWYVKGMRGAFLCKAYGKQDNTSLGADRAAAGIVKIKTQKVKKPAPTLFPNVRFCCKMLHTT